MFKPQLILDVCRFVTLLAKRQEQASSSILENSKSEKN